MKRFFVTAVMLVILTVVALPTFAATASGTIDVEIRIPARVGIKINNTAAILFDLTSVTLPASFPGYYLPNGPETEILMKLFCNAPGGFDLDVISSGDFSATIPVSQVLYAPTGTPISVDGGLPATPWTAFSTTSVSVYAGHAKTTGWETYDQAVEFMFEDTDVPIATATVTLTYTIASL